MIKLIGQPVYDRAETHYLSNDYEKPSPSPAELFNDTIVHYIQLPVALAASLAWSKGNDVSHTSEGRKLSIDSDKEKIAWDWQIDADNKNITDKYNLTTDRLIKFLEDNEDEISEWKTSDAQKEARSLFINNAVDFNRGFPIDESRRFFVHLMPFIREVENKFIKPALTTELFDLIKTQIEGGNLSAENTTTLEDYIKPALRMLTMSKAIKLLAVHILPHGVYQNYISDRLKIRTRKPADSDVRREVAKYLELEGDENIKELEERLIELADVAAGDDYEIRSDTPRDYTGKKHYRV